LFKISAILVWWNRLCFKFRKLSF